MGISLKRRLLDGTNQVLSLAGVELVRKGKTFQDYIPLKWTVEQAEKEGLPLGEFIDLHYNVPGTTKLTVEKMGELGVFSGKISRVCEIGPGSGRYLEQVIEACHPEYYEIYETSKDWREWLIKKYHVIPKETDGLSLAGTQSESLDLVHAHKILYGNPIFTICAYLLEMVRVVKPGGFLVFDLLTEQCLTDELVTKWIASGVDHAHSMTSKQYALDFFAARGFDYLGGFVVPMAPGVTEYFVFKKQN